MKLKISSRWRDAFRRSRALALPGLLSLLLAACSGSMVPEVFAKKSALPCPKASILAEAAEVTLFRPGGGQDLTDIAFQAEIAGIDGTCQYMDDDRVVEVGLVVRIAALRGPGATTRHADFPFFVAILDPAQNILVKKVFPSAIVFPQGRRRAGVVEELQQTIPLRAGEELADGYEILMGFQLSAE